MPSRLRAGTAILLAAAAILADGCACDVPDGAITDCSVSPPVPQAVRTDILFVIDDSGSMGEEQTNLQTNLDTFIQGLKDSPVANDFQVGVTTTSVTGWTGGSSGEAGRLVGTPGVLVGSSATFVSDFQARGAAVGTGGSGKEQGLLAMRRALSAPLIEVGGVNEGFLRQGARLAVVFLSDEDDCSDSVSPWADNNNKCHNYAGDGIDYKATVMDPIMVYAPNPNMSSAATSVVKPEPPSSSCRRAR